MGVVVRRYIDFLILLIPTPLVSVLFYSSIIVYHSIWFTCIPQYLVCMYTTVSGLHVYHSI